MTTHLRWLLDDVLPYWAEAARDERGGFVSELDETGAPVGEDVKLCLVQARTLFVYARAFVETADARFERAARHAHDALVGRFRHPDGGWMLSTSPDGHPVDLTRDFYDQAFVLFGLSWWWRATGDAEAPRLIAETADFLDRVLAHPAGGWRETDRGALPRRQNPHMHLLEACQAIHEATGDAAWAARAETVIGLFRERFFDAESGSLREYLADDLAPLPSPEGTSREPGHHMEWVWLLLQQRRLGGDDGLLAFQERLFAHTERHAFDAHGLVIEEVGAEGEIRRPTLLLWPQTELVKALTARAEFCGGSLARAEAAMVAMRRLFFPGDRPLWANRLAADGSPLARTSPTRVLYHLAMAIFHHAEVVERLGRTA